MKVPPGDVTGVVVPCAIQAAPWHPDRKSFTARNPVPHAEVIVSVVPAMNPLQFCATFVPVDVSTTLSVVKL
jgi:hypothetical protein